MSAHELDQALYEWFGKSCEFSCISEIETEKALKDQENIKAYDIPSRKEGNIPIVSQSFFRFFSQSKRALRYQHSKNL